MTMTSQTQPTGVVTDKVIQPNNKAPEVSIKAGANTTSLKTGYLTEAEILMDASIEAKSLGFGSALDIKEILNFDYAYRWVNRSGMGGQLNRERRIQGWLNATLEDVVLSEPDGAVVTDGSIVVGDVVLMKMPIKRYYGAIKANLLKAQNATVLHKREARDSVAQAPAGLVNIYNPPTDEVDKKVEAAKAAEASAIASAVGIKK